MLFTVPTEPQGKVWEYPGIRFKSRSYQTRGPEDVPVNEHLIDVYFSTEVPFTRSYIEVGIYKDRFSAVAGITSAIDKCPVCLAALMVTASDVGQAVCLNCWEVLGNSHNEACLAVEMFEACKEHGMLHEFLDERGLPKTTSLYFLV